MGSDRGRLDTLRGRPSFSEESTRESKAVYRRAFFRLARIGSPPRDDLADLEWVPLELAHRATGVFVRIGGSCHLAGIG